MAKLTRVSQNIFGEQADTDERIVIGSFADGNTQYSTDPEVIQSLGRFKEGLFSIVVGENSPTIEDMNALYFLLTRQIAYLLQNGVPEWSANETYYQGSIVNVNGQLYVSLTDDNTLPISNVTAWKEHGNTLQVTLVNGRMYPIFTYSNGCYATKSGKEISTALGVESPVDMKLSPDNEFLAYLNGLADVPPRLVDTSDENLTDFGTAPTISVASTNVVGLLCGLDFSPDGRFMASGTKNSPPYVHIWERVGKLNFNKLPNPASLPAASFECSSVAFSPDGSLLAFAGFGSALNNCLHVYVKTNDSFVKATVPAMIGPVGSIVLQSVSFSPDGKYLLVSGDALTNYMAVYSISYPNTTGMPTFTLLAAPAVLPTANTFKAAFHPTQNVFVFGTTIDGLYLYRISGSTTTLLKKLEIAEAPGTSLLEAYPKWHPDGKHLMILRRNTLNKSVQVYSFDGVSNLTVVGNEGPPSNNNTAGCIDFTNDFKTMFILNRADASIRAWVNPNHPDVLNKTPKITSRKGSYKAW